VKAPLAQTEFLPVWYGYAKVSTEVGCQVIVQLLADCSLFDIGTFYLKVHLCLFSVKFYKREISGVPLFEKEERFNVLFCTHAQMK
jgi:hypothetical protein